MGVSDEDAVTEVGQPHETGKNLFMVDAPTFRLCMLCSGLCRFVPAKSQFRMKKLQPTKILCDACRVRGSVVGYRIQYNMTII